MARPGRRLTHSIRGLEGGIADQLLGSSAKSRGRAIATMQAAIEFWDMKIRLLMTLIIGITSVAHGKRGGYLLLT